MIQTRKSKTATRFRLFIKRLAEAGRNIRAALLRKLEEKEEDNYFI